MNLKSFQLNDIVVMKNLILVVRINGKLFGWADIRIKCLNCGRSVLMPRSEFERKMKKL